MSTPTIDLALDVAAIVMRNGGSTLMADRAFRNVLKGCGQDGISAVWRMDLVAAFTETGGRYASVFRPIGAIGTNLLRVSEAVTLGERVANGEVHPADISSEVARINAIPPPYGALVLIAAAACASAAFTRIASGDWGAFGLAFVAGAVGQGLRSQLLARKLPAAPVTMICGALSASIAAIGLRLGWSHTAPAAAIASVMYMVPGLTLINGFLDAVSQKHLLMGIDRIAYAAFVFLVLVIAIAFAQVVFLSGGA